MPLVDKKYIGQILRKYRKNLNLTQEELAEKIGIAEKHYGKLERGTFSPSLETFFKLINILNIPISEFGLNEIKTINPIMELLLKEIYSSDEKDLNLYLKIIKSIKDYNKK